MTREEVYQECLTKINNTKFLLLELATGYGKTKTSIDLVNHLIATKYKGKKVSMLLLVAKTVHKQTWQDEMNKWGGVNVSTLTVECYESLKKHKHEYYDIIVMDECHHINSDARLDMLSTLSFNNLIGLSATVPQKLKMYFKYKYHAEIVSCDLTDAIDSDILPEPQIILMPLELDNTKATETIELSPNTKGRLYEGNFADLWRLRKAKVHAIIKCTPKQKLGDMNNQILFAKNRYQRSRQDFARNRWLFLCGDRIKYLANLKNDIVLQILSKLKGYRSITFCKTIEQAEILGKYCIHSKNKDSDDIYNDFNAKKINHITSVNVLNEGANLVDCKYAVFANYSSSEICSAQRIGRSLRHKSPIIIMPYYKGTREEEIVDEMIEGFNKDAIRTIHSIDEL